MLVWRICRSKHTASALSGVGAQEIGGRWNHRGDPMVYASTSLSLACLELFVHLEPNVIPNDLCSVAVTLPESISMEELTISDLPSNWRTYPAPSRLQDIGSTWLRDQRSFALIVPSAVNPEEKNVLLNPLHPEAGAPLQMTSKPFHYDPRMWKPRSSSSRRR